MSVLGRQMGVMMGGCCLIAAFLAGAPRLMFLLWWLFAPGRIGETFNTFAWPLLGVIFMPWTTLAYVFAAPGGLSVANWVLIGIALLVDLAAYAGGARGRRS